MLSINYISYTLKLECTLFLSASLLLHYSSKKGIFFFLLTSHNVASGSQIFGGMLPVAALSKGDPAGLWVTTAAPAATRPPAAVSHFPAAPPCLSSATFACWSLLLAASWEPIFIGPRTFLATVVSWLTKLVFSPGETGRDLQREGPQSEGVTAVGEGEGEGECSSTTSRRHLSSQSRVPR